MISLLTYDAPHRRTQDLVMRLLTMGIKIDHAVGVPWTFRKNHVPAVPHRIAEPGWPAEAHDVRPRVMFKRLRIPYEVTTTAALAATFRYRDPKVILVGGAAILPKEFVDEFSVLNLHCGLLPVGRGLDALKWCIYHNLPIGVTAHLVDEKIDVGRLVMQREVPILRNDSFQALSHRQYEAELNLVAPALETVLAAPSKESFLPIDVTDHPSYRRMPNATELEMLERFKERVPK